MAPVWEGACLAHPVRYGSAVKTASIELSPHPGGCQQTSNCFFEDRRISPLRLAGLALNFLWILASNLQAQSGCQPQI
jgi:hypothetical protein